jgi:hypothetical protein
MVVSRSVRVLLAVGAGAAATLVTIAGLAETGGGGMASGTATAAEPSGRSERPRVHGPTVPLGGTYELTLLPGSHLYPRYLADPRQPMMRAQIVGVLENDTPQTGSPLYEFALGASYALLRLHPAGEPEHGVELGLHAGLIVQFDPGAAYDGIGWDGFYGLGTTSRMSDEFAVKLAYQHQSSHIVDEYLLKTGRRRIRYTREELVLGVMVDPSKHVRVYTELAYAFHLGAAELAPWRTESGVEFRYRFAYAAVDFTFWDEGNFRPTTTVQGGLIYERPGVGRRYGIFGQYERGRSKFGEFYQDRFEAFSAGWWLDL